MTLSEIFDALNGNRFTYLECRDGRKFGRVRLKVNFCDDENLEPACIEVKPDGLVLHFNSDDSTGTNMRGESVAFGDIVNVR